MNSDTSQNDPERLDAEELIQVHQARDEWEGTILVGYLRDNGMEAVLQPPLGLPPLDGVEVLSGSDKSCGISVLAHDAADARRLVQEFLAAATDEGILEETAARQLRVDKETIGRLRGAVREERRTFELLGWIVVVFFGAMALLWAIWPVWLKIGAPAGVWRLLGAIGLALVGVVAGSWANKHLR